jgi:hypothetical protein
MSSGETQMASGVAGGLGGRGWHPGVMGGLWGCEWPSGDGRRPQGVPADLRESQMTSGGRWSMGGIADGLERS